MPTKIEKETSPKPIKSYMKNFWFERHKFVYSAIIILLILAVLIGIFNVVRFSEKVKTCGDSSLYDTCSETKPYYCEKGILIEKSSVCGCPNLFAGIGDSCTNDFQTAPKNLSLNYIIDGQEKTIEFTVYKKMSDYLSSLSRGISYLNGGKPQRSDFAFKKINEENQSEFLLPLVIEIQNLAPKDKEKQARIAVSLVQNIQYGFSNKTASFFGNRVNYSRYPYEVLYDSQGVCGEKSELLAFLLRKIGYDVVLFYNQKENHESVGIKCPIEESYRETGYCFVETTGPSIISDDGIVYVGGVTLNSQPEVIPISEGESLPEDLREYGDAETMKSIRQGKFFLFKNLKLWVLKKRYGLVESYNLE
ncbi:MAG: hypothetical protein AABX79_00450 [Nanoarchaeota archaeon]